MEFSRQNLRENKMTMRPDDHRRKWDKNEYQKLAQERLLNQSAPKEEGNLNCKASLAYKTISKTNLNLHPQSLCSERT